MTRIPLPDAPTGVWRDVTWTNDEPRDLERARLEVTPPTAFRQLRVYRTSGELLANEAWRPSRDRELIVRPANTRVAGGEALRILAMAWSEPVTMTAVFTWKGSV
jgi:hypothetical protein